MKARKVCDYAGVFLVLVFILFILNGGNHVIARYWTSANVYGKSVYLLSGERQCLSQNRDTFKLANYSLMESNLNRSVVKNVKNNETVVSIPKIMHRILPLATEQTLDNQWKREITAYQKSVESQCDYHSDGFKTIYWNSSMLTDLMNKHYPWLKSTWYAFEKEEERVNLARNIVLFHYGGIFLDIDIGCKWDWKNLLNSIPENKHFVLLHKNFVFSNKFAVLNPIAAISDPCHPFWFYLMVDTLGHHTQVNGYKAKTQFLSSSSFIYQSYQLYKFLNEYQFYRKELYLLNYSTFDDFFQPGSYYLSQNVQEDNQPTGNRNIYHILFLLLLIQVWSFVLGCIVFNSFGVKNKQVTEVPNRLFIGDNRKTEKVFYEDKSEKIKTAKFESTV